MGNQGAYVKNKSRTQYSVRSSKGKLVSLVLSLHELILKITSILRITMVRVQREFRRAKCEMCVCLGWGGERGGRQAQGKPIESCRPLEFRGKQLKNKTKQKKKVAEKCILKYCLFLK